MRETHINNISAGLVVSSAARSGHLAKVWLRWARWLVENRDMLKRWSGHVDQVSFALAMEELGEDVAHLSPQTNLILHLFPAVETPIAVHLTTGHIPRFASRFMADKTLVTDDLPAGMADGLGRLNKLILQAVAVLESLPSTSGHTHMFLNPAWKRG